VADYERLTPRWWLIVSAYTKLVVDCYALTPKWWLIVSAYTKVVNLLPLGSCWYRSGSLQSYAQ